MAAGVVKSVWAASGTAPNGTYRLVAKTGVFEEISEFTQRLGVARVELLLGANGHGWYFWATGMVTIGGQWDPIGGYRTLADAVVGLFHYLEIRAWSESQMEWALSEAAALSAAAGLAGDGCEFDGWVFL